MLRLLVSCLIPLLGDLEARTWTDVNGRQFEAEIVRIEGSELLMELPGGKRFTMSIDGLALEERVRASRTAPAGAAGQDRASNLGWTWPKQVRHDSAAAVKVLSEDSGKQRFIYQSPHYRFICNVRLTQSVLRNFSVMFETTYRYCQSLPLSMVKAGGKRFEVLLFETDSQYVQAGGTPGSAGCYVSALRRVMAPLSSLGVIRQDGGYRLDQTRTNDVLIHELAHQLTPAVYYCPGARGWFSEGLAEYVSTTPYSWGYFRVDPHGSAVRAHVTAHGIKGKGGRALGREIQLPSLASFFVLPYARFGGAQAARNYGMSLMLVHYFFHMDGQGKAARVTAFLKALNAGRQGADALALLLDGRSIGELEQEISKAWLTKGVKLQFGN